MLREKHINVESIQKDLAIDSAYLTDANMDVVKSFVKLQSKKMPTWNFESENYKINVTDNDKEKTHTLIFKVPLDSSVDSVSNIDIDLKFEQID